MSQRHFSVKTIIFDMDGVITNTMPDHFHAWKVILAKENIPISHYDIYSREGQPGLQSVREFFAEQNRTFDINKAKQILLDKENYFKKILKMRYITGARRFIRHLHAQGFTLALVTGTARHELDRMLPESIQKLFTVKVTGNDVKHGKPHPEPFLRALKQLKMKSKDGVVIENAPFGIQAAKAAGLQCLAVETSLPRKHLRQADAVFKTIKELEEKVKFIVNL